MRNNPAVILSLLPAFARAVKVDFNSQIQPILSENCYAGHGPDEAKMEGGLRLDTREFALKDGESGKVIVPGDDGKSLPRGGFRHAAAPPFARSRRLAADPRGAIRALRFQPGIRAAPCQPPLRQALGARVAGCRPLLRFRGLRKRPAADAPFLPGLGRRRDERGSCPTTSSSSNRSPAISSPGRRRTTASPRATAATR